jgi:hypothetical protein
VLFRAGESGDGCYRIEDGLLKLTMVSNSGAERILCAALLLLLNAPLGAVAQPIAKTEPADERNHICQLIEAAAKANALPVDFFARLIWQESRFQPDEIGPVTRNGQRAQGIAQFMPGTAAERQLLEPFNPIEALPKSGEFLAELRAEVR